MLTHAEQIALVFELNDFKKAMEENINQTRADNDLLRAKTLIMFRDISQGRSNRAAEESWAREMEARCEARKRKLQQDRRRFAEVQRILQQHGLRA